MGARVRRAPHVLCTWNEDGLIVQSARRPSGVPASALILDVLARLGEWTDVSALADALDLPPETIGLLLDGLRAHDLVEDAPASGAAPSATGPPWTTWSPAAHLFHLATRDVSFARRPAPSGAASPLQGTPRPSPVSAVDTAHAIDLPMPDVGDASLRAALRDRRTHRVFGPGTVPVGAVATLLGATFGVQAWTHPAEGPLALKTSPSGGARHSLEAFVWARRVDGLAAGLYHYHPDAHALTPVERAAPPTVTRWLPQQEGYEDAAVVVVMASVLARVAWRYRSARAYRVVLIEAGHLGQTFCLTAAALGLAPFCTGALADRLIEADLGIDGATQPAMYAVGVGVPAPGPWRPHADRPAPSLERTSLGRALDDAGVTRPPHAPRPPRRRGRAR